MPILVVGGLLGLAVIGIFYTFYQRQQALFVRSTAPVEHPPVAVPAVPAVPPLKPAESELMAPIDLPAETAIDSLAVSTAATASETAPAPSETYQKRMELIRRIEDQRIAQWESALSAEGGVAAFTSNVNDKQNTQ